MYFTFFVLVWFFSLFFNPLSPPRFFQDSRPSVRVYSDQGILLREVLSQDGGRRLDTHLNQVSPDFIHLLLSTEDKRFFFHPGVDPFSVMRALYQNVMHRRVISGASTLTMQFVRQTTRGKRNINNKLKEMAFSLYLELTLSKAQILEAYINRMPFSNELYGLEEAAHVYFRKNPSDLSLSESAWLIGIIRAPSAYNPYKNPDGVKNLRDKILKSCLRDRRCEKNQVAEALKEKIVVYPFERKFKAPHFTDYVLDANKTEVHTTLDLEFNEKIEQIIHSQLGDLKDKHVMQAAVLVISNDDAKIRGYVGSSNYWDDLTQGMNDGVQQSRQPGSALKPFNYALALDSGIQPSHVLPDVKIVYGSEIGDYIPENYDRSYRGPVLMRSALANSLNIPATFLLQEVGLPKFYHILKDLQFSKLKADPDHYGLGLTLGNVDVSLFELTRAYSIFGREGIFCELSFFRDDDFCDLDQGHRIYTRDTVQMIRDFLSDRHARELAFGSSGPLDFDFPVMIKTGTSQNYRDNWTVAVTPDHTIGVWVGNFNGDPMQNVSGVTGAAPIAHHIVDYLYQRKPWQVWNDESHLEKMKVCALSGKLPTRYCDHTRLEYVKEPEKMEPCDFHVVRRIDRRNGLLAGPSCPKAVVVSQIFVDLPDRFSQWQQQYWSDSQAPLRYSPYCSVQDSVQDASTSVGLKILSPDDGAVYRIDLHRPKEAQFISLKTTRTSRLYKIFMDEVELSFEEAQIIPLTEGRHNIKLVSNDSEKVMDEVNYWVK